VLDDLELRLESSPCSDPVADLRGDGDIQICRSSPKRSHLSETTSDVEQAEEREFTDERDKLHRAPSGNPLERVGKAVRLLSGVLQRPSERVGIQPSGSEAKPDLVHYCRVAELVCDLGEIGDRRHIGGNAARDGHGMQPTCPHTRKLAHVQFEACPGDLPGNAMVTELNRLCENHQ
jgi:hypothetical protein